MSQKFESIYSPFLSLKIRKCHGHNINHFSHAIVCKKYASLYIEEMILKNVLKGRQWHFETETYGQTWKHIKRMHRKIKKELSLSVKYWNKYDAH